MIPDLHTHSRFSSDSFTAVEDIVTTAIEKGMDYICITDHQDYDAPPLPPDNYNFLLGNTGDTEPYLLKLQEVKQKYKSKIHVLLGIELGIQEHLAEKLTDYVQQYPFDFVIASSHYFDGLDGGDQRLYQGRSTFEACKSYFQQELQNLMAFNEYDVVGHLDFVLRHTPKGAEEFHYKDYGDEIDFMLKRVISEGKGIECNTNPCIKGFQNPNPNWQIWKRYKELGGEIITFGSDAHTPDKIGGKFDMAADMLKELGFNYYCVFEKRKPIFYKL